MVARAKPAASMPIASSAVRSRLVTTDDFNPPIRYEAWREQMLGINEVIVDPGCRAGFSARVEHWQLGRMQLSDKRTPAMRLVRRQGDASRDGHDELVLRVTRRGVGSSAAGDRRFSAGPGELVIESLTEGYEDIWTEAVWVTLKVPRDLFPGLEETFATIGPGPVAGTAARLLADYLLALPARLPLATEAELPMIAGMTRSMIAHSLLGTQGPRLMSPCDFESVARAQVGCVIDQHVGSACLTPRRICDLTGISRSSLYRMFEGVGGVANHIQQRRLQLVHAALCDPARAHERISTIAERFGFHCTSSFNRTFRRAYGMTPGELRALALGASRTGVVLPAINRQAS